MSSTPAHWWNPSLTEMILLSDQRKVITRYYERYAKGDYFLSTELEVLKVGLPVGVKENNHVLDQISGTMHTLLLIK